MSRAAETSPIRTQSPALPWLMRLRWVAVFAQGGTAAICLLGTNDPTPQAATAAMFLITASSNAALSAWARRSRSPARADDRLVAGILIFDVLVLSLGLGMTGGATNPFAILYIVHIAMAGIVARSAWSWAVVASVVLAYGALFAVPVQSHLWHQSIVLIQGAHPVQLHMIGMWVATGMAAVAITYFTREILRSLDVHRHSLRAAEQRLRRTSHLASLTTLAAGAAHELGSPLATVAILARELERRAEQQGTTELREDAGLIRDEVERCREILERMSVSTGRDYQEGGSSVAGDALIHAVSDSLDERAARISWKGTAPQLSDASVSHLSQLMLPLLGNALDASEDQVVRVSIEETRDHFIIEVEDEGQGMEAGILERSVEPFFTTKAPGQGMGLGLHLVRVVTEAMGGTLHLDSKPGRGTCARLDLPWTSIHDLADLQETTP